jgi:hypothetical protein
MAAVLIDSREAFHEVLASARARTEELASAASTDVVWPAVRAELELITSRTADGATPSRDEQLATKLGPIALRHLEDVHPELARQLQELDYAFRRYGALP